MKTEYDIRQLLEQKKLDQANITPYALAESEIIRRTFISLQGLINALEWVLK